MDVGDIVERDTFEAPEPPKKPQTKTFERKWAPKRRPVVLDPEANAQVRAPKPEPRSNLNEPLSDAERIHLENIRKIQQMSPEEIEREREDIFRNMDPNVLQSLLRRAEMKDPNNQNKPGPGFESNGSLNSVEPVEHVEHVEPVESEEPEEVAKPVEPENPANPANPSKSVSVERENPTNPTNPTNSSKSAKPVGPENPTNPTNPVKPTPNDKESGVHFPPPPDELRKYFPDLPVETEKLAWMQPIADDEEAEYSSELASIAPSELRFDFHGDLITPRLSRSIPTSAGLHHHGDAPSAAGYTLPELSHLARSSHPAQRALAIQTAGRVLHKFKLGKFNRSSDLQEGLQALVHTTRIMETLEEAVEARNLTVRTLATEALWLANTK